MLSRERAGMRFVVKGKTDQTRAISQVKSVLRFLKRYGIKEVSGLNIYFNPIDPNTGKITEIIDPEHGQIDVIQVAEPENKPRAKRIAINEPERKGKPPTVEGLHKTIGVIIDGLEEMFPEIWERLDALEKKTHK